MKKQVILSVALAILLTAPSVGLAQQSPEELLQSGLYKEEVEGDLEAAIRIYAKIVADYADRRLLAANALVRMGHSYEKLGRAEAEEAYRRVLREYADQQAPVAMARSRLAALTQSNAAASQYTSAPAPASSQMTVRRVSVIASPLDIDGRVSLDGRYLPLEDEITGDLVIRDLTTGEDRRLTHNPVPKVEDLSHASISPDSKWIAYSWDEEEGGESLRIIGMDGSGPRVLYHNPKVSETDPDDWSPDGTRILARFRREDRTWQIVWVDVADGSVEVLKSVGWWSYPIMHLSPDGRYIAYDVDPHEETTNDDIFLLAADGSSEVPVAQHPADEDVVGWTPDGKTLLFFSDRMSGTTECQGQSGRCKTDLWAIEIAEGRPAGSPRLVRTNLDEFTRRGVTRTGALYFEPRSIRSFEVYTTAMDAQTGEVLEAPTLTSGRFQDLSETPAWSPDGRYLAYSNAGGLVSLLEPAVLVIRTLETGEERAISLPYHVYLPHWSPDGGSILAFSFDAGERAGLELIDVETSQVTSITAHTALGRTGIFDRPVGWSADGTKIYLGRTEYDTGRPYAWTPTSFQLLERDLESGRETELYRGVGRSAFVPLALAPDRRRLAFLARETDGGPAVLTVADLSGGETHGLLEGDRWGPFATETLTWTPDGRYLLFGKYVRGENVTQLWRVPAEGGEPERLGLEIEAANNYPVIVHVHPDGRRLAFNAVRTKHLPGVDELWVMENFLQKQEGDAGGRP